MISMWSRYLANSETSAVGVPSGPMNGVRPTAAVRMAPLARLAEARSSLSNRRKLAVSLAAIVLQPMPALLGYSQSKFYSRKLE